MTSSIPQSRPHYPYAIRALIDLYASGEIPALATLDIEPQYGHVARLTYADGSVRMIRGPGLCINSDGAGQIAKDKAYSKFFLERLGYRTPRGRAFLMPDSVAIIRSLARHKVDPALIDQIYGYAETIGYPCFVKPNDGSQGRGIFRCVNADELAAALESYRGQPIKLVLLEEEVAYADYRVVVVGDRAAACYRRLPLMLIGDGQTPIAGLLARKEREWLAQGRKVLLDDGDRRLASRLARQGYTLETVLGRGETLQAADIANLSAGGSAEDFSALIDRRWAELCVEISRAMGLSFCGVDLACGDITDPAAPYAILEINAAPGMDNFAALGAAQTATVREIYREIFNEILPRGG